MQWFCDDQNEPNDSSSQPINVQNAVNGISSQPISEHNASHQNRAPLSLITTSDRNQSNKDHEKPPPEPPAKRAVIFKKGHRVRVKQRAKSDDSAHPRFIWAEGTVLRVKQKVVTVQVGGSHMRIRDFSKIEPVAMIEIDSDSDGADQSDIEMVTKSGRRNQTKKIQSAPYQRGRRRFEQDEDDALRAGIVQYKHLLNNTKRGEKGIWYRIKHDEQFRDRLRHRTPAMLFNRYRVYVKNGTQSAVTKQLATKKA